MRWWSPTSCPRLNIWHFDFYRFNDPREWEDAGFRDIFASPGLKLAEWPQKAASRAAHGRRGPAPCVPLDDNRREVTLTPSTPLAKRWCAARWRRRAMKRRALLQAGGLVLSPGRGRDRPRVRPS